jgi:hypothetical protein
MKRATSRSHVQDVVAIDDRVLRNYWVTQSYADIAAALTARMDPTAANWCTFGVWASDTVGYNLRGEGLPGWLRARVTLDDGMMGAIAKTSDHHGWDRVTHALHHLTPDHVIDVMGELFGAAARNLSDGNTEVFAEIAMVAATFLEVHADGRPDDPSGRATVLAACAGATEFEGENHLAAGMTNWCDALAADDPIRRNQLIFTGNLHLATHEQHHLQDKIEASIDMGVDQATASLTQRLAREPGVVGDVERPAAEILGPIARRVNDLWGDVSTELLGILRSPDGTLRLAHDIPPLPGIPFIPPDLAEPALPELAALLVRFDRTGPDGDGSGAADWVSFEDRMNFITSLFRSRHHRAALFAAPFPDPLVATLEADQIPVEATR